MLEKAADNTAHADAITDSAHAGPQSAHAADDQINFDACLRGAIQRHDDVLVQQGIHLGYDTGWPSMTRVLGLARDQSETTFGQIKR